MNSEPWLLGGHKDLDPVQAAVLYSFEQAAGDIRKWLAMLSDEELWRQPGNIGSVGFHIKHIAGSVDRLTTYATGQQLSEEQMGDLKRENEPRGSATELLEHVERVFERCGAAIRSLDPADWSSTREIGRKRVPVPLGVLLVHIAEHTQRHVGEVIVTSKLVRGDGG